MDVPLLAQEGNFCIAHVTRLMKSEIRPDLDDAQIFSMYGFTRLLGCDLSFFRNFVGLVQCEHVRFRGVRKRLGLRRAKIRYLDIRIKAGYIEVPAVAVRIIIEILSELYFADSTHLTTGAASFCSSTSWAFR